MTTKVNKNASKKTWQHKTAAKRGDRWRKNLAKGKIESDLNPSVMALIRKSRNLRQEDVAARLSVSEATVQGIERGRIQVDLPRARKIGQILGRDVSYLFSRTDSKKYVAIIRKTQL